MLTFWIKNKRQNRVTGMVSRYLKEFLSNVGNGNFSEFDVVSITILKFGDLYFIIHML